MSEVRRRKVLGVFKYFLSLFFCFGFFASAEQIIGYFMPRPAAVISVAEEPIPNAPETSPSRFAARHPASMPAARVNYSSAPDSPTTYPDHTNSAFLGEESAFSPAAEESSGFHTGEATILPSSSSLDTKRSQPSADSGQTSTAGLAGAGSRQSVAATTDSESASADSPLVWDQSRWDEGVWAP